MHRLTDDRMKWGRYALLTGVSIALLASPLGPPLLYLIGLIGPAVVWGVALPSLDWKPYVLGLFAHQLFTWAGLIFFWGGLVAWLLSGGAGSVGKMTTGAVVASLVSILPVCAVAGVLFAIGAGLYRLSRKQAGTAPLP